jgi:hypothetical protein
VRALLAYVKPVASVTGNPSSSVRSATVGPAPFFNTPTKPVPPMPVVTSKPSSRRRVASFAAVFTSWLESSGD